jgi:hypothetical protein
MSLPREDRFDELFSGSNFTPEETEFFRAIDRYKRRTGRLFLSWHEVLRIARDLGYRRVFGDDTPGKRRHKQLLGSTVVFRSAKERSFAERRTTVTV